MTLGQALAYVCNGMYGPPAELGLGICCLLVIQLLFGGLIVLLLDELLQKGYGFGSGISLFVATNTCETIIWKAFSPITIHGLGGVQFEGAVLSLVHALCTRGTVVQGLRQAFYRDHLTNMSNLLATVLVFAIVIYFQGFRVDVPIKSMDRRGDRRSYPIKLFYTSNTPIMLQSSLVSNVFFITQVMNVLFFMKIIVPTFILCSCWHRSIQGTSSSICSVFGKAHSPLADCAITCTLFTVLEVLFRTPYGRLSTSFSCLFPVLSSRNTGSNFRDLLPKTWVHVLKLIGSILKFLIDLQVARQLREQRMIIAGHREKSMIHELNRYIPTAAAFGGLCIGALSIVADLMGAIGSGTGILLTANIIYQYFELFVKEQNSLGGCKFF